MTAAQTGLRRVSVFQLPLDLGVWCKGAPIGDRHIIDIAIARLRDFKGDIGAVGAPEIARDARIDDFIGLRQPRAPPAEGAVGEHDALGLHHDLQGRERRQTEIHRREGCQRGTHRRPQPQATHIDPRRRHGAQRIDVERHIDRAVQHVHVQRLAQMHQHIVRGESRELVVSGQRQPARDALTIGQVVFGALKIAVQHDALSAPVAQQIGQVDAVPRPVLFLADDIAQLRPVAGVARQRLWRIGERRAVRAKVIDDARQLFDHAPATAGRARTAHQRAAEFLGQDAAERVLEEIVAEMAEIANLDCHGVFRFAPLSRVMPARILRWAGRPATDGVRSR